MNPLDKLVELAQEKADTVVKMEREGPDDMDDGMAAMAFVVGTEEGDAMIVSATISGDGKELSASISTFEKGEPVDANILQIGNSILVTSEIKP